MSSPGERRSHSGSSRGRLAVARLSLPFLGGLLATLRVVLANSGAEGVPSEAEPPPPRWITVVAHRGEHTTAHENSLAAIEGAIRAGADYVELDVRSTRDGELVLLHDGMVDRTTDGRGHVVEMRWEDVQRLTLTNRERPALPPGKIPRLAEALGVLQGRAGLYLDFKGGDRTKIARLLREFQMLETTIVYDGREGLRLWKDLEPRLRVMTSPSAGDLSAESLPEFQRRLGVDILDGDYTTYTAESVRLAHRHGLRVWPDIQGPHENAEFWDQVLRLGADGYQTDRPTEFVRHLQSRGLRTTLPRDRGAITRARVDRKRLAVVFTGHEYAEGGPAILEALAERRLRAAFFLTGTFLDAAANRPLVERMIRDGHYVGPHSDRHLPYCAWEPGRRTLVSRQTFEEDLGSNVNRIVRFGIERSAVTHFLPAYEHHNSEIAAWTAGLGLALVNPTPGTRSAADYTGESDTNFVSSAAIRDSIFRRETEGGLNGWILLFHLGAGPGRSDKMHSHVGEVFDELARRGYEFVRVDQLLADEPPPRPVFFRFNQLGYHPQDRKQAIAFSTGTAGSRFEVVSADSGQIVFAGEPSYATAGEWGRFSTHAALDFSPVTQVGRFRLRFEATESEPFLVAPDIWSGLSAGCLEYLRQQRCGDNPWLDAECHSGDGRTAYGPRPAGSYLDARGGWHDAADLLKYLLTSGNATAQLLLAWELHRVDGSPKSEGRSNPLFSDTVDERGRPGANEVPDLLDEAQWGLQWLLKLHPSPTELYHQVADDRDHYGLRLPQHDQANYGWGAGSNRVVYAATGVPQGLGRFQSESTGVANLAGRYAAAMALAWQIWREVPGRADFARRCLQAGREVYALGKEQEGVQQGNSYGAPYRYAEATWADDMEWGAAELYRATGEPGFLADAIRYAREAGATSWMGREQTEHYEFYPFFNAGHFRLHGVAGPDVRAELEGYYRAGLERCATAAKANPYGIGVPFIWCSNHLVVALVTQACLYEAMSGDHRHHELMARHRDWLLGRNPWGITMFTGIGTRYPAEVHLLTTRLTGRPVRGGLVDGPVQERIFRGLKGVTLSRPDAFAAFQDPRAVYHDDWYDYSSNEPTMDGTASAVLMAAVLELR